MKNQTNKTGESRLNHKILVKKPLIAFLLTLPMVAAFYYTTGASILFVPNEVLAEHGIVIPLYEKIAIGIHFGGAVLLLFMIFVKDKIDFIRKVIFVPAAACFTLWFTIVLFKERGHLFIYTPENVNCGDVPFCHIVIPQTLIPSLLTGKYVFPGTVTKWTFSMMGMIATWFGVTLVLGRGFCSWGCFWGGWETGAASILKKPIIKKVSNKLKWGAFAMLFSMALASLVSLTAVYCIWLCPFQGVSEFAEVTDWVTTLKFVLFALIFITLVIVLPFLTKKRMQCIAFCPFGAFQSLWDKITPFSVRIQTDKCTKCQKCIKECPMNAITKENLDNGKIGIPCTKCGKCIDVCSKNAVSYHIKGTRVGRFSKTAKVIFLYLAFFVLVLQLGGMIQYTIKTALKLLMTGSI